ncbi:hypothetical protein L249_2093 [Ophiocordyceps polyrhachis-furcata BCC 54312]|uniref:Uncharacterized protein n=1 Tax=Ophiocordyceps polyrhachis-furcata BCC 54312 TaxID=1330021 RepID=A0A367LSG9_9HYPO|nr:hypothetical protein L249_2093 [Ophiocordyceps polyrhachis-furcata BCC 54312]
MGWERTSPLHHTDRDNDGLLQVHRQSDPMMAASSEEGNVAGVSLANPSRSAEPQPQPQPQQIFQAQPAVAIKLLADIHNYNNICIKTTPASENKGGKEADVLTMHLHSFTTIINSLSLSQLLWPVLCEAGLIWPWSNSRRPSHASESYSVGRSTFYRNPASAPSSMAPASFLHLAPERNKMSPGHTFPAGRQSQSSTASLPRRPGTLTKQVGGKVTLLLPPEVKPPFGPSTPVGYGATPGRQQRSVRMPSRATVMPANFRKQPLVYEKIHHEVPKATVRPANLRKPPFVYEDPREVDRRPALPKKAIAVPPPVASQNPPEPPLPPPRKRRKQRLKYVEPINRPAFSSFRPPEPELSSKASDGSPEEYGRRYEKIDEKHVKPGPEMPDTPPPTPPPWPEHLGRKQSTNVWHLAGLEVEEARHRNQQVKRIETLMNRSNGYHRRLGLMLRGESSVNICKIQRTQIHYDESQGTAKRERPIIYPSLSRKYPILA